MKKEWLLLCVLLCSVTLLFGQADNTFRFALLTDLHVTKSGNAEEDLQRAVNQINAGDDIEFVLVTGDLSEEGDRESLQKAKNILDRLKVKYYAIPGNHETKWSESGVTAFGDIFGGERFRLEYRGFLFLGFNTGPLMRMADGHVAPQDIRWLKEELKKAGQTQPVILVTHYPLLPGDVDNWYDLTDAVRPYNIRTFLGGHYHTNRLLSYDGIPGILNRSTLRDKEPAGGYSVYDITPDSMLVYEHNIGEPRRQWAALPLKTACYDPQGALDKYPDFSVNQAFPSVKEAWLVRTGVGIYSSPAVYDGKVYVGDDQGTLTCYTLAKGKKQWTFQSGQRIVGTPAAADGVVVFGSADKQIYGLDARTGRRLWTVAASEPVLGAVTIENGIAYIGASDHAFRAIDILTGRVRWTYTGVKGYIETRPLIEGDKVIFGAWDNTLYALDKNTGKEIWKWTGGLTRMHFSPAAVWPVAAHGKVFITDPQRAMTAIDLDTGETVWRTFQSTVRETIALSADKERVYSKTMNDSVVAYSTRGDQPVEIWASDVAFGYEHAPSMPVEKDGVVFGSTRSGLIFALDAPTGRVRWKHKIGNSLISTVVPLSSTQLLFTATGGEVGLLEVKP
ncbi:MAG: PQQ-binding-like beta-propeller repeat protein [Dysgonamonadaceae bacterium]|jgi:outer membrane protein assembly factor BamB/predicted phosphodiesterase|nr:PQQ-binding-like beta-propeller repeat protein [Dysgonamonadaceae bacterium]